jgi:hypothetical protein
LNRHNKKLLTICYLNAKNNSQRVATILNSIKLNKIATVGVKFIIKLM